MPGPPPPSFQQAISELQALKTRNEIEVIEAPAPQRLAPYALALTAEITVDDLDAGDGRLVLLYDPEGQSAWQGDWRVVVLAKAYLEPEMAADPMLSDVGWSWLEESLAAQDIPFTAFGGTVTRTHSVSYGAIGDREPEGQLEVRASWTPLDAAAGAHAEAWISLLEMMAGLNPLPQGVTSIAR